MWRSARVLEWSLRCSRPFSSIASSRQPFCLAKTTGVAMLQTKSVDLMPLRNFADSEAKVEKVYGKARKYVSPEDIGRSSEPKNIEFDDKGRATIYVGDLTGNLKRIKIFSLLTSTLGLAMVGKVASMSEEYSVAALVAVGTISCIFTFISPLFIDALSRRYITKILYDAEVDKYTFITYNFFHMRREYTIPVDSIISPEVPMSPFSNVYLNITELGRTLKKPVFVNPSSFIDKAHYIRFMRYDKPVDLKIDDLKLGTPEEVPPLQVAEEVKRKARN